MKRAIVNVATGSYVAGQDRLRDTLSKFTDAPLFAWTNENLIGAPTHRSNPYAFKVYAIDFMRKQGYDQILWLDASVYAVRDLAPVWDVIDSEGYIMQYAGHVVGEWSNDRTLEYFGVGRNQAMKMLMYGNAGLLGLNFSDPTAREFFDKWKASMEVGMFKGEWFNKENIESSDPRCKGHRHDMTCGSIIANKLGMKYKKGDEWLQYAGPEEPINNDTIIFKAEGLTA